MLISRCWSICVSHLSHGILQLIYRVARGKEEHFYFPHRQCDMTHSWSLYIWDRHETLGGIIGTNNLLLHWKINVSLIKSLVKASVWKIFLGEVTSRGTFWPKTLKFCYMCCMWRQLKFPMFFRISTSFWDKFSNCGATTLISTPDLFLSIATLSEAHGYFVCHSKWRDFEASREHL